MTNHFSTQTPELLHLLYSPNTPLFRSRVFCCATAFHLSLRNRYRKTRARATPGWRRSLPRTDRPGPAAGAAPWPASEARDRKSTRLNSSHDQISYAVFCLENNIIELDT